MAPERQSWLELRVIREKNGDSLTTLSRRSGVSLSYLSQLESGTREPNAVITKKLALALSTPVSVLAKDSDEPSRIIAKLAAALDVPAAVIAKAIEPHVNSDRSAVPA